MTDLLKKLEDFHFRDGVEIPVAFKFEYIYLYLFLFICWFHAIHVFPFFSSILTPLKLSNPQKRSNWYYLFPFYFTRRWYDNKVPRKSNNCPPIRYILSFPLLFFLSTPNKLIFRQYSYPHFWYEWSVIMVYIL